MNREGLLFRTYQDYSTFKKYLNDLDALVLSLQKVLDCNDKRAPFQTKDICKQMQKMAFALIRRSYFLKKRLDVLNKEHFKVESDLFKFVSEKELWENRNHAYQYWM